MLSFPTSDTCLASIYPHASPQATGQAAAVYLRALAANTLPTNELIPLPFHMEDVVEEMMPQPEMDPHPCVVAVLSPTVPLRAVWRRRR